MPKAKLLVLAAFAVFAFCVPATASAKEGGQWLVNGTPLTKGGSVALASSALTINPKEAELKILTANFAVKCEGTHVDLEGGKIIGPDGVLVKKLTFHECHGEEPCKIEGELISTLPIDGLASLDLPGSLNAYILLLPETKNTFATIKFIGETCAISGTQPVTGDASILAPEALHEAVSHRALGITLKGALHVGSDEAHFIGVEFNLELNSKEPWSFR